ncbi:hypothetical protein [Desertivirga arenae]|uniref:hypothetical protein n=1 Tax=Desertivirga arenae TaxID=2810309 RepID=UPI001A95C992|nr:hypothetical protein [Pedobacter sp. SYSU D00823]
MIAAKKYAENTLKEIPGYINDGEILHILYTTDINWKHANAIKEFTNFKDDLISD